MNIYLISANSYHLINEEIKKITLTNPYLTINLNKNSLHDLIDEASYISLTGEKKYIIGANADFFGSLKINDSDQDLLIKYINNPNPNTFLIFTTFETLDSRKKIVKLLKEKGKIINIGAWDKKKLREEANKYLENNKYKADYNTMSYILDNIYNNTDILFNELDKIMLYYNKPCLVALRDVEKIVGLEIDGNNFHFINAVVNKDLKQALHLLNDLKVYKVDVSTLINLLAREYRLMFAIKKLFQAKKNIMNICNELSLQQWQVEKLYNNSLKYQEKEILKNLYILADIDLKIKKGIYDKDVALYPFLLEACI